MSAQILSTEYLATGHKLTVSFRLLLALYAIIPLCLLLQVFDAGIGQGVLRATLPSSPEHFLLFQILFGTPHIIASALVLVSNTEYLKFYKLKIILMTVALALFFGVGSLFISYRMFYVLVAAWTVYHVLKQQHGVARGVCHLPGWAFYLLLWLSVAAGLFIYMGIFLKNSLDLQQAEWVKHAAAGLCVGLGFSTVLCQRYIGTQVGKLFLWSNTLLVLSSFYLYVQQYYFLAILAPRLVHDATAYIFYVTHDYNRHKATPQNALYSWMTRCHIPIVVVLPVLSFALAFVLQRYGDAVVNVITNYFFEVEFRKVVTVGLLGYLALMHYYTEAFTWKQGSPYRRFIAFSK
jgi:hypothetical protein